MKLSDYEIKKLMMLFYSDHDFVLETETFESIIMELLALRREVRRLKRMKGKVGK